MTGQVLIVLFFVLSIFFLLGLKELSKSAGGLFPDWVDDLRHRRAGLLSRAIQRETCALRRGASMRIEIEDSEGEYVSWVVTRDHVLGAFEIIIALVNRELCENGLRVTAYSVEVVSNKASLVLTVSRNPKVHAPVSKQY